MRQTTITQHPDRDKIEAEIIEGVPAVSISTKYGISQSAISRHRKLRMSTVLAQQLADGPGVTDTLAALWELFESTRKARQAADQVGSPGSRATAQRNELATLTLLTGRLGIRDVSDLDFAKAQQQMSNAVVRFLKIHPEHLTDITQHLLDQDEEEWGEWVSGITDHLKKATT